MRVRMGPALSVLLAVALVATLVPVRAQKQPEHPKKEHPEESKEAAASFTADDLADAIEEYIREEEKKGGGAWKVADPEAGTTLELSLVRIHEDKLARTAPQTYFACVDARGKDGHMYDVDVFMKGPDAAHLEATEVSIHKKDGKERYTWREQGGVWKKVKAGGGEHPKEHPKEHPGS